MQSYKTIQLLEDNQSPPDNGDTYDYYVYHYCQYLRIELGRILDKKPNEVKPEDFRPIDYVTKWSLCLNSETDRDNFKKLERLKLQIEEEIRNPTPVVDSETKKRGKPKPKSKLEELESRRDGLIFKLNQSSLLDPSKRTFFVNLNNYINDINDSDGRALFRIGNLGSFGLQVYVKNVWKVIPIDKVIEFQTTYVSEWNGCGLNEVETSNFKKELGFRLGEISKIKTEDLIKIYRTHKAVFEDKTFYIQEKDKNKQIKKTSYKTYHRTVIPFKLNDIIVDKSLTEAKEIETEDPDTKQIVKKIVYPELEKEINKLGRIGKVLADRLQHRPDYINFCEGVAQTYCNIKSSESRIIIIIGTSNDGKSTLFKLLVKIGPDIWGACKFHLIYNSDIKTSSQNFAIHKDKQGRMDDEIKINCTLDATQGKEGPRNDSRFLETKHKDQVEYPDFQNMFGICNQAPKWSETGIQVDNRLLYLQSNPNDDTKDTKNVIGDYHLSFSEQEERDFLKHILQVGFVRLSQGKLGYSSNQASIDRINELKTDLISAVFTEFEITARPEDKRPIVSKSVLGHVFRNFADERQWKRVKRNYMPEVTTYFTNRNVVGGGTDKKKKRFEGWSNTRSAVNDYVEIDIGKQNGFLSLAYKDDKRKNLRTYFELDGSVKETEPITPHDEANSNGTNKNSNAGKQKKLPF